MSEIHFLKVLETKHKGIQTCRKKANIKPMKIANSVLRTLNIYGIHEIVPKKTKAPVQTYRNHTTYSDSEGQKHLKKTHYYDHAKVEKLGHIIGCFKVALIHSS